METPTQTFPALIDNGIFAYRNKEFQKAIECLQKVLDVEPLEWRAKLYLAMSYFHAGEVFTGYRHFAYLKDNCTDPEIRQKAEAAMKVIGSQMPMKMPEMTCTIQKPRLQPPMSSNEDGTDLEWIPTDPKPKQ